MGKVKQLTDQAPNFGVAYFDKCVTCTACVDPLTLSMELCVGNPYTWTKTSHVFSHLPTLHILRKVVFIPSRQFPSPNCSSARSPKVKCTFFHSASLCCCWTHNFSKVKNTGVAAETALSTSKCVDVRMAYQRDCRSIWPSSLFKQLSGWETLVLRTNGNYLEDS